MKQGVDQADGSHELPRYLLFTDADIAYAPDALRQARRARGSRRSRSDIADGEVALRELLPNAP